MASGNAVSIRRARLDDAREIARVQVDTWRTTYPGIVTQAYLDGLSYPEREGRWQQILATATEFIFVAESCEGQVVGFASGGPKRGETVYTGELNAIYLLERYQRQGIGHRLVAAAARELLQRGMRSMIVYVFAANPAREFYEALGGRKVFEGKFLLDGAPIADIAYGWENIEPLASMAGLA